MERVFKLLLPVLVVLEVILVWSGLIDLGTAVGMVIAIEVLLFLVAGRQIFVAVRRYRRDRAAGLDVWGALEEGLTVLMPRKVARLVVLEPRLWQSLGVWLLRRGPSGDEHFPYRKRSILGAFVVVILLTAPVEILLFELLIPWSWLRWTLLVLAIYALVWVVGLYASVVVQPHRLLPGELQLRYGALAKARISYGEIRGAELERRTAPSWGDGLQVVAEEDAAYFAIGGRTDVTLHLRTPRSIAATFGPTEPVSTIHVAVDEPERFIQELRQRLQDTETDDGEIPVPSAHDDTRNMPDVSSTSGANGLGRLDINSQTRG